MPIKDIVGEKSVSLAPGTLFYCTLCSTIEAKDFKLVNHKGLYAILCCNGDGTGCFERSVVPTCSFATEEGIPCEYVSEFEINSLPKGKTIPTCKFHVGALLPTNEEQYTIYPITR